MHAHLRFEVMAAVPIRRDGQAPTLAAEAMVMAHGALTLLAQAVVQRAADPGHQAAAFLPGRRLEFGIARRAGRRPPESGARRPGG